jgi:hypothetical protein
LLKLKECKNLQKLYIAGNKISKGGVEEFKRKRGDVDVDTGGYLIPVKSRDSVKWVE